MKRLLYILPILFLSSCIRDVDIEIDQAQEQIVVEAGIETGSSPFVILTKSAPVFGEFDFNNVQDYLVTGALVTVSNGTLIDTLTAQLDLNLLPPLVYRTNTPSFVGEVGGKYDLKIEVDGKVLTSSTTIPEIIPLDSTWIQEEQGYPGKGFVWGHLTDPDTLGNGYKWEQRLSTEPKYVSPLGGSFNDRIFNGKAFEFFLQKPIDPNDEEVDPIEDIYYEISDTVFVKFSAIDAASLNFWRTLDASKNNGGNPFASPITPITNINGGLGVFSGYAVSYDTAFYKP